MGTITYGSANQTVSLDDDVLAHIKAVAVMKLRRNESFTISWTRTPPHTGRVSIWVHPSISLQFEFESAERTELDRGLLEELMQHANQTGDLRVALPSASADTSI
ncbi:hypothetical protein [Plantibacter sp. YIM 135249]|uniref:DUF7882 family protein n=1 Tax=Plantibacter sp. YIM 135249 TaxID=3423918 RepID=UPI003D326AFB